MASNYVEFYLQLFDRRKAVAIDDDSGLFNVLTAGDPAEVTAYSDERGTSLTLPGTMTDGIIQFWVDSATTTVDITVLTSEGRSYFLEGVSISDHRIDVNTEELSYRFVVPYEMVGTADAAVVPTGFQLINGMMVKDVFLHKTDVLEGLGAAMLFDVGVSGDPDGFIDGITASATGYFFNGPIFTAMSTEVAGATDYVTTAQTRGALLHNHSAGLLTVTTGAAKGYFISKPYMTSIATATNNIVWAITGTSSSATGKGYIYIDYDLLITAGN